MFIRWMQYTSEDQGVVEAMEEAELALAVQTALNQSMIAADQYGTGVVVIISEEADLESPLDIRRIREGDVTALHYFDRYDLSVPRKNGDFRDANYGKPDYYDVHPSYGSVTERVHHSRVLRFDGLRPPTKSGYTVYDQDFGVSALVPIIVSLLEDQTLAQSIAHLSASASIPVLHIAGLREAIAGSGDPDEATPDQIGQQINQMMSNWRLLMLDEPGREEFMRVAVQFGGLADLMNKFPERVAAARKIPFTRFMGYAPEGHERHRRE